MAKNHLAMVVNNLVDFLSLYYDAVMIIEEKYGVVRGVGKFFSGLGWLILIGGILGVLFVVGSAGPNINPEIALVPIAAVSVIGITTVAIGQLLQILHAIERNTRAAALYAGVKEEELNPTVDETSTKDESSATPQADTED